MVYVIYGFVFLLNLLLFSKKKIAPAILFISFVFLWLINGWSSGSYDINNSMLRYYNPTRYANFTELLFQNVIIFSNKIGLSYRQYSIIISTLEGISLYYFINKYSKYPNLSLCLLLVYPIIYLFTLQRYFVAAVIVICFGIPMLIEKPKGYIFKYIFVVVLASLIHYSMLFFIVYLLVNKASNKIIWLITIVGSLVLSTASSFSFIISFFAKYIDKEKINNVIEYQRGYGLLGRVVLMLVIAIQFYVIYYYNKSDDDHTLSVIYKMNTLTLMTIPLTIFYSASFLRIYIVCLIFYYTFYFNKTTSINIRNINHKQVISITTVVISLIMLLYLVYGNQSFRELSLYPMFEQNEFFSGI